MPGLAELIIVLVGISSSFALDAPSKPGFGVVHVTTDGVARTLEAWFSLPPFTLSEDVGELGFGAVGTQTQLLGMMAKATIT